MADNKWCSTLILTYAKWNGMLNTCWGIKTSPEVEVLQYLWDIVYKCKIPTIVQSNNVIHTIVSATQLPCMICAHTATAGYSEDHRVAQRICVRWYLHGLQPN